ncbi:MAG: hypothetical protein HFH14_05330 [Lachnospiraceae bacterium]|nr:hypothetical protein [Lachnospiraceae bacterium]
MDRKVCAVIVVLISIIVFGGGVTSDAACCHLGTDAYYGEKFLSIEYFNNIIFRSFYPVEGKRVYRAYTGENENFPCILNNVIKDKNIKPK